MNFLENVKIIQKLQFFFCSKKVIILQFIGFKKKLGVFFVQMGALTKFREKLGPKA